MEIVSHSSHGSLGVSSGMWRIILTQGNEQWAQSPTLNPFDPGLSPIRWVITPPSSIESLELGCERRLRFPGRDLKTALYVVDS